MARDSRCGTTRWKARVWCRTGKPWVTAPSRSRERASANIERAKAGFRVPRYVRPRNDEKGVPRLFAPLSRGGRSTERSDVDRGLWRHESGERSKGAHAQILKCRQAGSLLRLIEVVGESCGEKRSDEQRFADDRGRRGQRERRAARGDLRGDRGRAGHRRQEALSGRGAGRAR